MFIYFHTSSTSQLHHPLAKQAPHLPPQETVKGVAQPWEANSFQLISIPFMSLDSLRFHKNWRCCTAHGTCCLTKLIFIRMIDRSVPAGRIASKKTLPHVFSQAFACITPGLKQNSGMIYRNEETKSGPSLPKQGCNAGGHGHGMPMLLATYQLWPWENRWQKQQLRSMQCDDNATCLEFTETVWIARLKATKCCVYTGLLQNETKDIFFDTRSQSYCIQN